VFCSTPAQLDCVARAPLPHRAPPSPRARPQCDTIANGIVTAVKEVKLKVPLIVRLEGTNVAQGKAILNSSGVKVITADDLDDAAKKAVKSIQ
jgi:succinyl-CoA synthetase beta subunit